MDKEPEENPNVDDAGRLLRSDVTEDPEKEKIDKGSVLTQMSVKKGIMKHGNERYQYNRYFDSSNVLCFLAKTIEYAF